MEKDEDRVEIFEYFLELMKHIPQISSSIIQLIQVNFLFYTTNLLNLSLVAKLSLPSIQILICSFAVLFKTYLKEGRYIYLSASNDLEYWNYTGRGKSRKWDRWFRICQSLTRPMMQPTKLHVDLDCRTTDTCLNRR